MDKKRFVLEEIYNLIELKGFYEESRQWEKVYEIEKRINNYYELFKTLECA